MTGLAELLGAAGQAWFWAGAAIFLRVGALVSMLPAFGERAVPVRIKIVIALAFTAIVAPAVVLGDGAIWRAPPTDFVSFAGVALAETLVGLALGIGIRLFIMAMQTAGSIAAQATSLSQILGGAAVEPIPAMGHLLVMAAMALALMSGLHVGAARMLILSYDVFPPGQALDGADLSQWGLKRVSEAFSLAFSLSAPFIIASVLYNLMLGVINRAMPQLMVAFVGAPVITFGGLALLMVAGPYMLMLWRDELMLFLANPLGAP
ncbi:flagellar biosynthetic protein FliR [Chachezhania antarctica]|uniref:flagellar biosynthetic protein FliR n=1 Tax=Chachezhania antarctica TaxID=2340860 RepID=UPI003B847E58